MGKFETKKTKKRFRIKDTKLRKVTFIKLELGINQKGKMI